VAERRLPSCALIKTTSATACIGDAARTNWRNYLSLLRCSPPAPRAQRSACISIAACTSPAAAAAIQPHYTHAIHLYYSANNLIECSRNAEERTASRAYLAAIKFDETNRRAREHVIWIAAVCPDLHENAVKFALFRYIYGFGRVRGAPMLFKHSFLF
jgi:hypothetical protein